MNNIASERVRIDNGQSELAERIGVSESTLRRWEKDASTMPSSTACELADIFGCTLDYLFARTEERLARA